MPAPLRKLLPGDHVRVARHTGHSLNLIGRTGTIRSTNLTAPDSHDLVLDGEDPTMAWADLTDADLERIPAPEAVPTPPTQPAPTPAPLEPSKRFQHPVLAALWAASANGDLASYALALNNLDRPTRAKLAEWLGETPEPGDDLIWGCLNFFGCPAEEQAHYRHGLATTPMPQYSSEDAVPGDYCPVQGRWYAIRLENKGTAVVQLNLSNVLEFKDPIDL